MTTRLLPALVIFLVALAHVSSLGGSFHYDDGHSLLRNPHIRSLGNVAAFFTDPRTFSENPEFAMYRPLVLLSYAANYALGNYDSTGYHLLNLLLHCAVTWAVLALARRIGLRPPEAVLVALAFGLHPFATEPISYVSSRSELLAGLFYLLATVGFVKFRSAVDDGRSYQWYAASVVAFVAGFSAKAVVLSLPLMLLVVDVLILPAKPRRDRLFTIGVHAPFWILGLLYYLLYRLLVRTGFERSEQLRDLTSQLATQATALIHYIYLAVMPVSLSVHQQFFESPSFLHPTPILALLAGSSLLFVAFRFRHAARLPTLSAGWFAVILLPTLVVPLHILVNDHRAYLATFGLALAFVLLAGGRSRRAVYGWCVILAILSWQRHGDWATELTLWTDAVAKAPLMPEAHYNLGHARQVTGDLERARIAYEEAVRLSPDYARAQSNLGALYRSLGDNARALSALRRAVQADPKMVEALNNLGLVLAAESQHDEAILHYRRAIDLRPEQAEIWMNLGLALRDNGQMNGAKDALQRALRIDPEIKNRFPAHGPRDQ